jgi:hypothetical protein
MDEHIPALRTAPSQTKGTRSSKTLQSPSRQEVLMKIAVGSTSARVHSYISHCPRLLTSQARPGPIRSYVHDILPPPPPPPQYSRSQGIKTRTENAPRTELAVRVRVHAPVFKHRDFRRREGLIWARWERVQQYWIGSLEYGGSE